MFVRIQSIYCVLRAGNHVPVTTSESINASRDARSKVKAKRGYRVTVSPTAHRWLYNFGYEPLGQELDSVTEQTAGMIERTLLLASDRHADARMQLVGTRVERDSAAGRDCAQMDEPSRTTSGRRLTIAAALLFVLLFISITTVACDSSSAAGCRRASSFLSQESSVLRASDISFLAAKKLQPKAEGKERVFNCSKQRSPQWQKLKPYKGSVEE